MKTAFIVYLSATAFAFAGAYSAWGFVSACGWAVALLLALAFMLIAIASDTPSEPTP